MAFQTPQRPLPGAFFNTPAASRPAPPHFLSRRPAAASAASQQQASGSMQAQSPQSRLDAQNQSVAPIQRAARTINEVLLKEANFPDLDSYVRQGTSSDYELPDLRTEPARAPFQRSKLYDIPDIIFQQWDQAGLCTKMGLFAELNHAWVTVDNALYLWDYTNPNPEIIGFEEQNNAITAVKLVIPRMGVFVTTITHLLVVATTAEILLLGIESSLGPSGVRTISLYNTRMSLPTRGTNVSHIEGSPATGRIFFTTDTETDVYELTYQQEEKWFASRCAKVNHTESGYAALLPAIWNNKTKEKIKDILVDDSRKLLYTLSSESTIRTYYMDTATSLQLVIEKKRGEFLRDISHMTVPSILLTNNISIVTISTVTAQEGSKLHLMAVTSTGCRLFLSATRGYSYLVAHGAPQSMQVQHIKFPPRRTAETPPQHPNQQQGLQLSQVGDQAIEISSQALSTTRAGFRFAPGLFFDFVEKVGRDGKDALFLAGPDTGRIAAEARGMAGQSSKYYEHGCWIELNSKMEDVGLVTKAFAASVNPLGFGNELAVQFDEPISEIAILTDTGVHVIRRRRLVDIFAAAIRMSGTNELFNTEVKRFTRQYGLEETAATALAVACGQGNDVSPSSPSAENSRVARINDPVTLEQARKAFVEHGGHPILNDNGVAETIVQAIDNVVPSARHQGLALYMGRLVRSLWKSSVITVKSHPVDQSVIVVESTVPVEKLKSVQEELIKLQKFLEKNQSFIEGLAAPDVQQRVATQQAEVALRGEHQAMYSLQKLNTSIIEGISFVQMLFDERVDEIWSNLADNTRQNFAGLTYELLFANEQGKELAKTLVKAIVNRNIANGSNVDTVAEALRRRCGTFCSADDVIIFKAQEQLKKASEVGPKTEMGRNLLNESLRLFLQVANALSLDNLHNATEMFAGLDFYAGAISLTLLVASESDRGNTALAWVNEGMPGHDARYDAYRFRKDCYELIHRIITLVDQAGNQQPEYVDGRPSISSMKRAEANSVVHDSDDELFHYDLYQWYLEQGWTDRLLHTKSPFVVSFLSKEARHNVDRADLLWRFYVFQQDFFAAATVQHELAQSAFQIPLARRIEYLSRAKANANTQSGGTGRQTRQVLLHQISELLEVANIQDEVLHRFRSDGRVPAQTKEDNILKLDHQVLTLTELFNGYTDPGEYFDLSLLILESSNHRNTADINATWQLYIESTHQDVLNNPDGAQQPYEAIVNVVREMSHRLKNSQATFSPVIMIPLIEIYGYENQNNIGPQNWIVDLFISVNFPFETILGLIQEMYQNDVAPFVGGNKRTLAEHMIYTTEQWFQDCIRGNKRLFGSEENAHDIVGLLNYLERNTTQALAHRANTLVGKITRSYQ